MDFSEYKKLGEPDKKEKAEIWETAIGLQQVDSLSPSDYLIEIAKTHINGDSTINDIQTHLAEYYELKPVQITDTSRTEEADKVSANITEVLSENAFVFSPAELLSVHKRLFKGIFTHAGTLRDYNISKKEWVLDGDTVQYASADSIPATLEFDFAREKGFRYKDLSPKQTIEHLATFISGIWQIHPFAEGNTRTTAVFMIKYLKMLGFTISNDLFKDHSWYFRNALVRANYNAHLRGIYATDKYLIAFLQNLILGEKNPLHNRELHIDRKKS